MNTFFLFSKKRMQILCLLVSCFLECWIVFFLYDLPLAPVWYGILLSFITLSIGAIFSFYKTWKKQRQLEQCLKQQDFSALLLPKPETKTEALYQELIEQLKNHLASEKERTKAESIKTNAYYTLWSHQIKTPIAAIRLFLQEEPIKKGALELELLKVEQYVDMALQYQRLDNGSKDLRIASYQLENMIKQVIKKIAPLFIYKKIRLDFKDCNCMVITDEKWTCFVIEQILTNAIKYTPEGGCISLYMDDKNSSCLVVRDTGIGILPQDLPRIFEWGYTGYNGRIKKHSTGIGLFLCRQVTDLLGHTISIESVIQVGTTVFLDFSHKPMHLE